MFYPNWGQTGQHKHPPNGETSRRHLEGYNQWIGQDRRVISPIPEDLSSHRLVLTFQELDSESQPTVQPVLVSTPSIHDTPAFPSIILCLISVESIEISFPSVYST